MAMSDPASIPDTPSPSMPAIWRDRAVERYLRGAEPRDRPRAVLVAGQPGAGKGPITEEIARRFARRGYAVIVDIEELKYLHPLYASLAEADDRAAMAQIALDIRSLAAQLIERAVANHANLIVETTLDEPEPAIEMIARLKQGEYHVTVIALQVDPETSWRSVQERFARQQRAFEVGTWVERPEHDRAAQALLPSLEALERQALADRLYVITRDGRRLVSVEGPQQWELGTCRRVFPADPAVPDVRTPASVPASSEAMPTGRIVPKQPPAKEILLDGKRRLRLGVFAKPEVAGAEMKAPAAALSPDRPTSPCDASVRPATTERTIKLGTFATPPAPADKPFVPLSLPPPAAALPLPPLPAPPTEPSDTRPPPANIAPAAAPPISSVEPTSRRPKRRRSLEDRPAVENETTTPPPAAATHETPSAETSSGSDLSAYPPEQQRAIRRRMELQEKLRRRIERGQ